MPTNDAPRGEKVSSNMASTKSGKRVVSRKGGSKAAKAATATKPAAKKGNTGRTGAVAKIEANVQKIAKALRGGATMKSQKAEFGVSDDGPIRKALAKAGFDSKGGKLEVAKIDASKAAGKKAVVKARSEGTPWYVLEIATGLTEGQLRTIVSEAGGATGRVYRQTKQEATTGGR